MHSFSLDSGNREEVVFRFTADPTCVDAVADGSLIAAGAEDMTVKVRTAEKETTFEGHEAPVLSVSVDKSAEKKFVVSSSCDGSVRVWRVSDGAQVHAVKDLLPKAADASAAKSRATVQWSPDSGSFAVAAPDRVAVYKREDWSNAASLCPPDLEKDFLTTLTWSGDGSHLAAATNKGCLYVWNVKDGKLALQEKTGRGYGVTGLAWNPKRMSEISFIDDYGWWGTFKDVMAVSGSKSEVKAEGKTEKKAQEEMDEDELAAALFEDSDDDENSFSIRQIKRDTGFLSDQEEDNSNQDGAGGDKAKENSQHDGDGDSKPAATPASLMPPPLPPPPPYEPDLQEPFQPTSTPSRLSSFFMVWNSVGLVRCINGGEDDSSIEVEFHDTSVHHPLHISNALGHTMADISSTNLALACEADEETLAPSRIAVHHFSDQGREWSAEMPNGEEVMAFWHPDHWLLARRGKRLRARSHPRGQHGTRGSPPGAASGASEASAGSAVAPRLQAATLSAASTNPPNKTVQHPMMIVLTT